MMRVGFTVLAVYLFPVSFNDHSTEQESVLDQLRTQIDQRNAEYSVTFSKLLRK